MLVYIIDGFNIVYQIPAVKKSTFPQSDLISYIKNHKLTGSGNNKIIIVFDGSRPNDLASSAGLEIIFSGHKKADEIIKNYIAKTTNKKNLIVVTDDREIRDYAQKYCVKILRSNEFLAKASKPSLKEDPKNISYSLQKEITDQMRKIWLPNE